MVCNYSIVYFTYSFCDSFLNVLYIRILGYLDIKNNFKKIGNLGILAPASWLEQ